MRRTLIGSLLGAIAALAIGATPAMAAGGYTLFGSATLTSGHDSPAGVELTSVGLTSSSGIDFAVPSGMTFSQLTSLGTDYQVTAGDCGGGAPRFSINFGPNMNIFVYIGPAPSFTGCPPGWNSTGNLLSGSNTVDTGQLGGTFYDSLSHAYAAYGSMTINSIDLVVDGGWAVAGGTQTVVVDNVNIDGTTYTFESAATCKNNGWQAYGDTFKNQGDCVSFFATGGTNLGAG